MNSFYDRAAGRCFVQRCKSHGRMESTLHVTFARICVWRGKPKSMISGSLLDLSRRQLSVVSCESVSRSMSTELTYPHNLNGTSKLPCHKIRFMEHKAPASSLPPDSASFSRCRQHLAANSACPSLSGIFHLSQPSPWH